MVDEEIPAVPAPSLTMKITVLLFASHREILGTGRLFLDVTEETTVEDVFDRLQLQEPSLGPLRPYTTFAVNRQTVDSSTRLSPGDEVALLQPVSGGRDD